MKQRGFTLIELVVVIVILGILAATALPKFVDLSTDADTAAVQGVAGAMSSGSSINFGVCKISGGATRCVEILDCGDAVGVLEGGALPANYSFASPTQAIADGATASCVVQKTANTAISATATVIGFNKP